MTSDRCKTSKQQLSLQISLDGSFSSASSGSTLMTSSSSSSSLFSCIACNVVLKAVTPLIPASSIACIHHFYTCHKSTSLGCMHPHILQPYLEVSPQHQAPAFKDLHGRLVRFISVQLRCKATSDSNAVQVQVNLHLLGLLCSLLLDAGTGPDHHRPISPSWPASHLACVIE